MRRDLVQACRAVLRMRGVALVIVGSLAFGIAANTIVFAWLRAVIEKPIAGVRHAGDFQLIEPRTAQGIYLGASWMDYLDLRDRLRAFPELAAFRMAPFYIGDTGRVERSSGMLVSGNYFAALGLTPLCGRLLTADDTARPDAAPVVVISYEFWRTRLGGSCGIVGQPMRVNGRPLTIVGVAPRRFRGTVMLLTFDLWVPATMAPLLGGERAELTDRSNRGYLVTGRLASGQTRAQADAELAGAMAQVAALYPATNRNLGAEVLPFWQAPRGPQRLLSGSLAVLQTIMVVLLLAVCGNIANLLLARGSARRNEIAIRRALGASRLHVARLLLAESLVLGLAGALAGAALAWWGTEALSSLPPLRVRGTPVDFTMTMDSMGLAAACAAGMLASLAFGLPATIALCRGDGRPMSRAGGASAANSRLRTALIVAEVALATMVLIAAGMFVVSFARTRDADPGFRRERVLLAEYDLTTHGWGADEQRRFAAALLARVRARPSVEAAALAAAVPLDIHGMPTRVFTVEGHARTDGAFDEAVTNVVTPGYFAVMGIPLRGGRDFSSLESPRNAPEAIVNETFVRQYLSGAVAVGRRVSLRGGTFNIIGVAADSTYNAFNEPATPAIYLSLRDRPSVVADVHARARPGAEAALAGDLRAAVREVDPDLPLYDVRTLSDHIEANLVLRRIPARLFTVLGPLLLVLAASGTYALVAYAVSLRTVEFGIRQALGATPRRIVFEVARDYLLIIAAGIAVGWIAAFGIVGEGFSYAMVDVPVFAAVPMLLAVMAAAAALAPARRAGAVDVSQALRHG